MRIITGELWSWRFHVCTMPSKARLRSPFPDDIGCAAAASAELCWSAPIDPRPCRNRSSNRPPSVEQS
jgi:hypothetical protein